MGRGSSGTHSGRGVGSMFGSSAAAWRPRRVWRLLIALQIALMVFSLAAPIGTLAADPSDPPAGPSDSPTPSSDPPPSADPTPSSDPTPSQAPDPTATADPTPVPDPTATPDPTPSPSVSPFIVTFVAGTSAADQLAALAAAGATDLDSIGVLRMHAVQATDAAATALRADSTVASVELDRSRAAEAAPDDTSYGDQWSLAKIGWDQVYGSVSPAGSA